MHKDINVNVSGPVQPTSTYKTVVLKGNHSFASQVTEPNTKYVIKHNFDLSDGAIVYEGWEIEGMGGNPSIIDGEEYWLTDYESGIAEPTTYNLVDNECFFVIDGHISDVREVTLQYEENAWIATKRRGYHARILSHYDSNAAITIPEGCLLEFDGGAISNGTLVGNETILIYNQPLNEILTATLEGTWKHEASAKADEEDITDLNGELKFKDKAYAPANYSGLGRKILRKDLVNGVNTLTQSMINQANTIYVIQYDFTVEGVSKDISLNFTSSNVSGVMTPEKAELNAATAAYDADPTPENLARKQKAQAAYEAIGSQDYYYWTSYTIPAQHCLHLTGRALRLNDSKNAQVATEYNQGIIYAPSNESLTVYVGNLAGQYSYIKDGYVRVPANCVLEFDGGSVNGPFTITGNNTKIKAEPTKIFGLDILFAGNWDTENIYIEWFGAIGNGTFDCADAFDAAIAAANVLCSTIKLLGNIYGISRSIHLFDYKNITLIGPNDCNAPWKIRRCTVKALSSLDVIFKLVDDYEYGDVPSTAAREISISNIYIDGDNKASTAINCIDALIKNVTVRNCTDDGIVFEAQTYPVTLMDSTIERCGGNGIHIKSPWTTIFMIERCEVNSNDKYGILIEGGYAGSYIQTLIIQGNKKGGMKIQQLDRPPMLKNPYLGMITFTSVYTENNGLLSSEDDEYEGNYALYIAGLNDNPASNAGKINGLQFYNIITNPSSVGQTSYIRGTYDLWYETISELPSNFYDYNVTRGEKRLVFSKGLMFGSSKPVLEDYCFLSGLMTFYDKNQVISLDANTTKNLVKIGNAIIGNVFIRVNSAPTGTEKFRFTFDEFTIKTTSQYLNEQYVIGSGFIKTNTDSIHITLVYNEDANKIEFYNDSNEAILTNQIPVGTLYFNVTAICVEEKL